MIKRYPIVRITLSADGCTAKAYDERGDLRSGVNGYGDPAYVARKIVEFWPGVPIDNLESTPKV